MNSSTDARCLTDELAINVESSRDVISDVSHRPRQFSSYLCAPFLLFGIFSRLPAGDLDAIAFLSHCSSSWA